tara:strand:+ start:193 stop:474 length:282 start_codon:yes stop_codon:yes gene_type:complete
MYESFSHSDCVKPCRQSCCYDVAPGCPVHSYVDALLLLVVRWRRAVHFVRVEGAPAATSDGQPVAQYLAARLCFVERLLVDAPAVALRVAASA